MKKNYIFSFVIISIILLISSFFPALSQAHNGGRDELGGHFRRADCVYMLHSPTPLAKSANSKQELIQLIKENNTNSQCTSGLSESKLDLEGYTFSRESTATQSTPQVKEEQSKPKATPTPLSMGQKYSATLEKCTDGDTANFKVNGQTYKTRFLYIDTPESTIEHEAFGKEASDFTCNFLKQGKITLETDGGEIFDKYDRLLAWVFVDDKLHQEAITKAGLVEGFYDYGDYKYEDRIISAMDYATSNYVGIYAENKPMEETELVQEEKTQSKETVDEQIEQEKEDKSVVVEETDKSEDNNENNKEDSVGEVKKGKSDNDEQLSSEEIEATEEVSEISDGLAIFILIVIVLFYMLPMIKNKLGVRTLIVHKLRAKRLWINTLLGILFIGAWFITLIFVVIELIHLIVSKKQKKEFSS